MTRNYTPAWLVAFRLFERAASRCRGPDRRKLWLLIDATKERTARTAADERAVMFSGASLDDLDRRYAAMKPAELLTQARAALATLTDVVGHLEHHDDINDVHWAMARMQHVIAELQYRDGYRVEDGRPREAVRP